MGLPIWYLCAKARLTPLPVGERSDKYRRVNLWLLWMQSPTSPTSTSQITRASQQVSPSFTLVEDAFVNPSRAIVDVMSNSWCINSRTCCWDVAVACCWSCLPSHLSHCGKRVDRQNSFVVRLLPAHWLFTGLVLCFPECTDSKEKCHYLEL